MGYMRHHAIVVTSWKDKSIRNAHAKAMGLFRPELVSPIIPGVMNKYASFLIAPDGSKEGWDESDVCDVARSKFLAWLKSQAYEDGSNALDYIEVQFGDDERVAKIIASGDDDSKNFRLASEENKNG